MKKVKLQNLLKKDLSKWTTSDSVFWLEYELKLPKYSPNFLKVPLTGHMMVQMSEVSLRNDLKIRDKNDWVKIIQAIKQLKGD